MLQVEPGVWFRTPRRHLATAPLFPDDGIVTRERPYNPGGASDSLREGEKPVERFQKTQSLLSLDRTAVRSVDFRLVRRREPAACVQLRPDAA